MIRWLALVAMLAAACGGHSPDAPSTPVGRDAVLIGAGDIGWCGATAPAATALLLDANSGTVFTAGDNAYPSGSADDFQRCYDPTWGRHLSRTRPSPGNHDYGTAGAAGYFGYFGSSARPAGTSYYAYTLESWRVIALDSNIDMSAASPQVMWLRQELQASASRCTLAYWHHPLFSSGTSGSTGATREIWRALYEAGADVVVNGHNHNYERFALQDPDGRPDPVRGIREFVAGTGGAPLYPFAAPLGTSEARGVAHGVLRLVLRPGAYEWEFLPIAGSSFHDSGSDMCR